MAARRAFARSAFREANQYFQIAMDAVDRLPFSVGREQRAVDLRAEARLSYVSAGNIEQWFVIGRDGEARAEKIGDQGRRLASITIRAGALNFYGTPYEAVTASEEAVELASQLNDDVWLGLAEYGLGQAYFAAGRYADADLWLGKAIGQLTEAPAVPPGTTRSSLLMLCHTMKAIVYASMGEHDEAVRSARQSTDLAESSGRPYDMVAAGYGVGVVHLAHGSIERADTVLSDAARLARENEVHFFLPLILCSLGNVYVQTGRAAEAQKTLLEAKELAGTLGHQSAVALASAHLASAYALLGDPVQGLETARSCQAGARQQGYRSIELIALLAEAAILSLDASKVAEAIAQVERAIELATQLGARPLLGLAKGTLARILAADGRKSEARDELSQAIELFAKSKMTIQLERARLALSKLSN
jgi:tetratricopeptide (TPR) repeat protein